VLNAVIEMMKLIGNPGPGYRWLSVQATATVPPHTCSGRSIGPRSGSCYQRQPPTFASPKCS
jgi:hypothetical protein